MPRLAIVISAAGSIESLEGTLVSVLENRPADCEIIVVLNHPYADPYDLAQEVRFLPPCRSGSPIVGLNSGLAATRAPFVHVLASGCLVSEGWCDAALARFGDRQVGSVAPLVWDADRADHILAAGVGYRRHGCRYLIGAGLGTLDAQTQRSIIGPCWLAGFYRKAALDVAGGFSTWLGPRQADADLAMMLRQAGFSVAFEPGSSLRATASADPQVGAFRQALGDERLFRRNLTGSVSAGAILAHWSRVGLEVAASFPRPRMLAQLAGRLMACCELVGYARHRRALGELAARAKSAAAGDQRVRIDHFHDAPARVDAGRNRVPLR